MRVDCQRAHVALDEHAITGAKERFTGVGAAPQSFADGADIEAL